MKKQISIKTLYLVIPCYNEEDTIDVSAQVFKEKMHTLILDKKISKDSKVLFVDDGSKDKTWNLIEKLHDDDKMFIGLKLAHNAGQQNALLAGLHFAKEHSDIAITMDVDLQDDISVIDDMLKQNMDGSDIVYGVRSSRKKDSFFKKFPALSFYKLMHLMGIDIVYNHAECRLMSRRTIEALEEYTEVNLFLRGIVPQLGFKTSIAYYERQKRVAGKTKYSLKKMIKLAIECITSFSIKPLTMITFVGLMMFLVSLGMLAYCLFVKVTGNTIDGWTFIVSSIWLVGGIQLLSLGVIGEYIGKIYTETKRRPRYIIEKELN